ncbi:MAG: hypothetical protein QOG50_2937, partial [Actinomycetota bacterium]|nr:hypothetical protein [Actinomycetota bacterium]
FITPEPHKRPKSSYVQFEAALPNECWQMDVTHVLLKNRRSAEVLNVIDDHSRLCLASRAFPVTTAADVVYDANLTDANLTDANLTNAINMVTAIVTGVPWSNTTCPDGTNSNSHGNTSAGHM